MISFMVLNSSSTFDALNTARHPINTSRPKCLRAKLISKDVEVITAEILFVPLQAEWRDNCVARRTNAI